MHSSREKGPSTEWVVRAYGMKRVSDMCQATGPGAEAGLGGDQSNSKTGSGGLTKVKPKYTGQRGRAPIVLGIFLVTTPSRCLKASSVAGKASPSSWLRGQGLNRRESRLGG